MKKFLRYTGILPGLLALLSLCLPVLRAHIALEPGGIFRIYGIHLAEFSPWGIFVLLVPFLLAGIFFCKLKDAPKAILILSLYCADAIALFNAYSAAQAWMETVTDGFIKVYPSLLLYAVLLSLSALFFFLCCTKRFSHSLCITETVERTLIVDSPHSLEKEVNTYDTCPIRPLHKMR